MEDYVSAKEAARALGIGYAAFMARVRRNTIACKRVGWSVLIHKDEIERVKQDGLNRNKAVETTAG